MGPASRGGVIEKKGRKKPWTSPTEKERLNKRKRNVLESRKKKELSVFDSVGTGGNRWATSKIRKENKKGPQVPSSKEGGENHKAGGYKEGHKRRKK